MTENQRCIIESLADELARDPELQAALDMQMALVDAESTPSGDSYDFLYATDYVAVEEW